MRKLILCFVAAVVAAPAFAQENPMLTKFFSHWKTSKEFTLAIADQMPASDYTFKPNPEEMSYGELMAHIAGANAYFFSLMAGEKSPIGKPADFQKTTVMKMLNDSYDYCASILPKLTPEQLHKSYDTPDGNMVGVEIIMFALDHSTHHRGQAEVYLRVKNIKPADYRF